jgi:hypothetical protein
LIAFDARNRVRDRRKVSPVGPAEQVIDELWPRPDTLPGQQASDGCRCTNADGRLKEDPVDDGEGRDIRANANRKAHENHGRDAEVTSEASGGMAQRLSRYGNGDDRTQTNAVAQST